MDRCRIAAVLQRARGVVAAHAVRQPVDETGFVMAIVRSRCGAAMLDDVCALMREVGGNVGAVLTALDALLTLQMKPRYAPKCAVLRS